METTRGERRHKWIDETERMNRNSQCALRANLMELSVNLSRRLTDDRGEVSEWKDETRGAQAALLVCYSHQQNGMDRWLAGWLLVVNRSDS